MHESLQALDLASSSFHSQLAVEKPPIDPNDSYAGMQRDMQLWKCTA
jgi:hypothetical protein